MGVSKNNGTPKSSILIGISIINHPYRDTIICGNTYMVEQHDEFGEKIGQPKTTCWQENDGW